MPDIFWLVVTNLVKVSVPLGDITNRARGEQNKQKKGRIDLTWFVGGVCKIIRHIIV